MREDLSNARTMPLTSWNWTLAQPHNLRGFSEFDGCLIYGRTATFECQGQFLLSERHIGQARKTSKAPARIACPFTMTSTA